MTSQNSEKSIDDDINDKCNATDHLSGSQTVEASEQQNSSKIFF
jgi:hypothetical protein